MSAQPGGPPPWRTAWPLPRVLAFVASVLFGVLVVLAVMHRRAPAWILPAGLASLAGAHWAFFRPW